MSILIKGMKMPEKCGLCDLFHVESPMHCTVVKGHKTVGAPYGMPRPEWCPLVALPDKHGRLIDGDAVFDWYVKVFNSYPKIEPFEVRFSMNDIAGNLLNMPTIIEAEGDEE